MRARRRVAAGVLATFYSVPELAEMTGLTRQMIHRLIEREQMRVFRRGRIVLVPITAFRDAFPEVWEELRGRLGYVAGSIVECGACGSEVRV